MKTYSVFTFRLLLVLLSMASLFAGSCSGKTTSHTVSLATIKISAPPDGKQLYESICLACHMSVCDDPGDVAGRGFTAQYVTAKIWSSNTMSGIVATFTPEQLQAIIAYVTAGSAAGPPPEIAAAGPTASLFWDKCSGCHGVDRQGGLGPALVPQTLAGLTQPVLEQTISDGRPGTAMPPWKGTLSDQDISDLAGYILSPVQEAAMTWGIDDMCGNCVKVTPTDQLPAAPNWGGKVADLMVVTERDTGHLLFIDSASQKVVGDIEAGYAIHAPTFTPRSVSDRWLWAIARNGWLIKVDLYSLQVVGKIRVGLDSRGTAVSTDGKYVMVGNYIPNDAVIVDAETLKPLKIIETAGIDPSGQMVKSRVAAVLSTPIGPYFEFALKEAGQVCVADYSKPDFPLVAQIADVGNILHDGFLTPDGRYLQVASQGDGAIVVIDLKTMAIVQKIPAGKQPHPGPGAVFESQGRTLAATTAIGQGLITIWDTATWQVVKTIPTPGPGLFIRSDPSSPYVWADCGASADSWDNVVIFDRETLNIVATLQPGKRAIHPEFTSDHRYVYVSCWNENKVVVYDAATLRKVTEFPATTPTGIFSAGIRQVEVGA